MPAGLDTFAKVRALHDRTTSPGEKAAAAGRMEALARSAGMTVAEAVSKLDEAASRPASGMDWAAFTEAFRRADAAGKAADAPEAPSRRRGLPIYDPNKVEPWRDVAEHCLQLDWIIPKAHGGRFLTKDERDRLKVIARHHGSVTNGTADWIETVLARCDEARKSWRDRGKGGVRPDRKATESDIEKAAELVAAAKRREASRLDTPEPEPEQEPQARTAADAFSAFFNSPEMRAAAAQRETKRQARAAAAIDKHGSEEAVFADTPREAALRAACAHLVEARPGSDCEGWYRLAGWDGMDGRDKLPVSVREAVRQGWPLPGTVAEAWAEHEAAEELDGERHACCRGEYHAHLWVEARRWILEEMLDSLPARSMRDLRARLAWMQYVLDLGFSRPVEKDQACLDALRGDVDRMGERIRAAEHGADLRSPDPEGSPPVQTGHCEPGLKSQPQQDNPDLDGATDAVLRPSRETSPGCEAGPDQLKSQPLQSGQDQGISRPAYPSRRTNIEKRRDVLDLLGSGLSDREIARRAGVSAQTVGNIRRTP
ncbi:hypothetical protein DA075_35615 (plasmid) [Methylobacterium currus]|uniref:Uncharacterized protein n=1 Tax=Methylobacterium currus TaxID=2051553 RepID=A0A2R4WXC8_9HYPH|nr:hypothetical protein DA075_35615 [Methylobacterium currus]